jgi:hypothetical protein
MYDALKCICDCTVPQGQWHVKDLMSIHCIEVSVKRVQEILIIGLKSTLSLFFNANTL